MKPNSTVELEDVKEDESVFSEELVLWFQREDSVRLRERKIQHIANTLDTSKYYVIKMLKLAGVEYMLLKSYDEILEMVYNLELVGRADDLFHSRLVKILGYVSLAETSYLGIDIVEKFELLGDKEW